MAIKINEHIKSDDLYEVNREIRSDTVVSEGKVLEAEVHELKGHPSKLVGDSGIHDLRCSTNSGLQYFENSSWTAVNTGIEEAKMCENNIGSHINNNAHTTAAQKQRWNQGKGRRYITLVVGAVSGGYTEKDVDYLCTGTNDPNTINEALRALPADGGRILFLDGTYIMNGNAWLEATQKNIIIEGCGRGTIFVRQFDDPGTNGVFLLRGDGIVIRDLCITRLSGEFVNTDNIGVLIGANSSNIEVANIYCMNQGRGIFINFNSTNIRVLNNTIENASYRSILTNYSCKNVIISNNIISSQFGSQGIYIDRSSQVTITDNSISSPQGIRLWTTVNSIIDSNIIHNDTVKPSRGITMAGNTKYIVVSQNLIEADYYGLHIIDSEEINITANWMTADSGIEAHSSILSINGNYICGRIRGVETQLSNSWNVSGNYFQGEIGLQMLSCEDFSIEGNYFNNIWEGIQVVALTGESESSNITIAGNFFEDVNMGVWQYEGKKCVITGNYVAKHNGGFDIQGEGNNVVSNQVDSVNGTPIEVGGRNNQVNFNMTYVKAVVNNGVNNTVSGNKVT